jgi:hypothetical protein
MPAEGGEEKLFLAGVVGSDFAIAERGIYFIRREGEVGPRLELHDSGTGETHPVTVMDPEPGVVSSLAVSPDERWVLYTVSRSESDIMLVESFE